MMGDLYIINAQGLERKASKAEIESMQNVKFEKCALGQSGDHMNRDPQNVFDNYGDKCWLAKHLAKQT